MLQKIERKQKFAKIVLFAGIILTAQFVICMVLFGLHLVNPDYAWRSVFTLYWGIGLLIAYFVNYYPFENCMKMLKMNKKTPEYCLQGMENAPKMPKSKIICASNSLIFEKQKWVIPYQSVIWIYKQEVRGVYGLVTVEANMMIATDTGHKFKVKNVKDDELMWMLHNFRDRFPQCLVVGYSAELERQYKELIKRYLKK